MRSTKLTDRIEALEQRLDSVPRDLRCATDEQLRCLVLEGIADLEREDPDALCPELGRTYGELLIVLREALSEIASGPDALPPP